MTDHVRDPADRIAARMSRGENWETEFAVEFGSLTSNEQDELLALVNQRSAHGEEKLEALSENIRILKLLFAYKQGAIDEMEFVHRVRSDLN